MLNCLVVGIGGFVGSALRYLVGRIPIDEAFVFPIKTLAVNIIAALIIGVVAAHVARNPALSSRFDLLFRAGFCGGFSTFSAFSLETVRLFTGGHSIMAVCYIVISVAACAGAVVLGSWLINA